MYLLDRVLPKAGEIVRQEHYDNTKALLDRWAEWQATGEPIADGAPRECLGAPDARIHSFEDMEIEDNKRIVRAVNAAVWELQVVERNVVMMHYGIAKVSAWRAQFDTVFDMAIESLFKALKGKVAC